MVLLDLALSWGRIGIVGFGGGSAMGARAAQASPTNKTAAMGPPANPP